MFIVCEYSVCLAVVLAGTTLLFTASVTFVALVEGVRVLARTLRRSSHSATHPNRGWMRAEPRES